MIGGIEIECLSMFGYLQRRVRAFKQKLESILKYPDGKRYYRDFHNIRKKHIDHDAEKVINRLHQFGHKAYLVGGCIRDFLLNRKPKDFDIVTSAHPNEVRNIFKNSRIIGRRFKINHVFFGRNKIIEVSTARSLPKSRIFVKKKENLYLKHDNTYGNFKEDAARRDFTLNSLYFDLRNETIIDYTGGVNDIQKKIVKTIGSEGISLPEDPVRILRAVKFASVLEFDLSSDLLKGIRKYKKFITKASIPRLHEEFNKIFWTGKTYDIFEKITAVGLFTPLFPQLDSYLNLINPDWNQSFSESLFGRRLKIADKMISEHEDINNILYYGIMIADFVLDDSGKNGVSSKTEGIKERNKRAYEKSVYEKIMKVGKDFGLTRREAERLTKMFSSQNNFLQDSVEKQNKASVKIFKEKDYFLESFILYKVNARAKEDNESIQKAFFWEISLREKLPDAIPKLVPRTLDEDPFYFKKRNQQGQRPKKNWHMSGQTHQQQNSDRKR